MVQGLLESLGLRELLGGVGAGVEQRHGAGLVLGAGLIQGQLQGLELRGLLRRVGLHGRQLAPGLVLQGAGLSGLGGQGLQLAVLLFAVGLGDREGGLQPASLGPSRAKLLPSHGELILEHRQALPQQVPLPGHGQQLGALLARVPFLIGEGTGDPRQLGAKADGLGPQAALVTLHLLEVSAQGLLLPHQGVDLHALLLGLGPQLGPCSLGRRDLGPEGGRALVGGGEASLEARDLLLEQLLCAREGVDLHALLL